jgi:hypothetical protein
LDSTPLLEEIPANIIQREKYVKARRKINRNEDEKKIKYIKV